jgi:hypothetical protein
LAVGNLKYHSVRTSAAGWVVAFKDVAVRKFPVGIISGWISTLHEDFNELWANLG